MTKKEQTNCIKANEFYKCLNRATTTDERYYYLNSILTLLNDTPNLKQYFIPCEARLVAKRVKQISDCPDFDINDLPRYQDGIDRETEKIFIKKAGLYFIGEITYDPTIKTPLYWVKIGVSTTNLGRRPKQYDTHCPTTWRIDFCGETLLESYYHKLLGVYCLDRASAGDEWFRVDEKTYFEMCAKGFSYFD